MADRKRIFITGGSSYVGQHFVANAIKAGIGYEVGYSYYLHQPDFNDNGITAMQLDLRDVEGSARSIIQWRPDVIMHLAGSNRLADPDRPQDMRVLIENGTAAVTKAASTLGIRLVHMSTDVIFNGRDAPYHEDDPPTPVHAYGHAKVISEQMVATYRNHVIVRPSLIYGLEKIDRGSEWMIASLNAGKPVTLFTNQLRSPVWVETLSAACFELGANDYVGILHVVGSQTLSRAEFGIRLLDWWGIESRDSLSLAPAPLDAPWPPNTVLNNGRAKEILQTPMLGVDEVIALNRQNK